MIDVNYIISFGQFWYDFIVGDDWTIAVVVVVVLALIKLLKIDAWWLLPLAVIVILGLSLWRVAQSDT